MKITQGYKLNILFQENSQEGRVSSVVEIDEEINEESAVLEVGGEIVNLGGAVVVEEEVDTTVHEVEVLVSDLNTPPSSSSKCVEEEDSIQDDEIKEQVESPETELQDESQVEDEGDTPTTWLVFSYILYYGKISILNLL